MSVGTISAPPPAPPPSPPAAPFLPFSAILFYFPRRDELLNDKPYYIFCGEPGKSTTLECAPAAPRPRALRRPHAHSSFHTFYGSLRYCSAAVNKLEAEIRRARSRPPRAAGGRGKCVITKCVN
ncbi:hypothetical protein EVAR_66451_1 [Eumeta japonica]|uniref:Uncharacterized protein n=1 Tax=Eumeta variegata TaxID=151549 RepID=A0A4C2A1D7_EUMVA|nr:hypothetical protein EVAR_66451_1 [Eumeta japonica]